MDKITIHRLKCLCRVGVPDWERKRRQRILLDIELRLNLSKAGRSDDLKRTVDYFTLSRKAKKTAEGREFYLLEALAEAVARELLKERRLMSVRVAADKKPKLMPDVEGVSVEIVRGR